MSAIEAEADELPYHHRGEPCPRKGEPVLVLWLEPGSTTSLVWTPAVVRMAMPSRGLFIAEWPRPAGPEGDVCRHTFDVDRYDWKRP